MKMFCKHCGSLISDGSIFCQKCGRIQNHEEKKTRTSEDINPKSRSEFLGNMDKLTIILISVFSPIFITVVILSIVFFSRGCDNDYIYYEEIVESSDSVVEEVAIEAEIEEEVVGEEKVVEEEARREAEEKEETDIVDGINDYLDEINQLREIQTKLEWSKVDQYNEAERNGDKGQMLYILKEDKDREEEYLKKYSILNYPIEIEYLHKLFIQYNEAIYIWAKEAYEHKLEDKTISSEKYEEWVINCSYSQYKLYNEFLDVCSKYEINRDFEETYILRSIINEPTPNNIWGD